MHTIPEAAKMLGVSPQTLRLQARIGKLRAIKMGREWLVTTEEVERYRRENLRSTNGNAA
jgi:excisionase family DNA binding protein